MDTNIEYEQNNFREAQQITPEFKLTNLFFFDETNTNQYEQQIKAWGPIGNKAKVDKPKGEMYIFFNLCNYGYK